MKTVLALMMSAVLFTSFNVTANTDNETEQVVTENEITDLTMIEQNQEEFLESVTGFFKKGWEKIKGLFAGKKPITEAQCPTILKEYPTKSEFMKAAEAGGIPAEKVNDTLICFEN